jgi:hypothetical protein
MSLAEGLSALNPSAPPLVRSQPRLSPRRERVDCFSVFAEADPSVLPRVFGIVAMFDRIPERCHADRLDGEPGRPLVIDLQIAGLSAREALLIRKQLERMVDVSQVLSSEKHRIAA